MVITIVGMILPVAAALLTLFLSNRSNERQLRLRLELEESQLERRFLRDKREELFITFKEWTFAVRTIHQVNAALLDAEITPKRATAM